MNLEDRIAQLESEIAWLVELQNKAYDLGFKDGYEEADLNRFLDVED
jgi:hypothetical protein